LRGGAPRDGDGRGRWRSERGEQEARGAVEAERRRSGGGGAEPSGGGAEAQWRRKRWPPPHPPSNCFIHYTLRFALVRASCEIKRAFAHAPRAREARRRRLLFCCLRLFERTNGGHDGRPRAGLASCTRRSRSGQNPPCLRRVLLCFLSLASWRPASLPKDRRPPEVFFSRCSLVFMLQKNKNKKGRR